MTGKTYRSSVTNGRLFNADTVDGRTANARRFRDLYFGLIEGAGGPEVLGCRELQLCRRGAAMAVQIEMMENDLAAGRVIDFNRFNSATNTLLRIFRELDADDDVFEEDEAEDLEILQEHYAARKAKQARKNTKLRKRPI